MEDYWTADRVATLLAEAEAFLASHPNAETFRLTLSPFGDEREGVLPGVIERFGWSRRMRWPAADQQITLITHELSAELRRVQAEHSGATGGPSNAIAIYLTRDASSWLLGLWPRGLQ